MSLITWTSCYYDDMAIYKKGVFIGKFYPMHNGHLSTLRKLAVACDEAYLIFYHDHKAEKRLASQLGADYAIQYRLEDAKQAVQGIGNVTVNVLTIGPDMTFPKDFLKIKELVKEQIKGTVNVQIFGEEEVSVYSPYKYSDAYLLGPAYEVTDEAGVITPLHATAVRNNYPYYRAHLPTAIRTRLDELLNT